MRRTTILQSAALCAVAALVLAACGGGPARRVVPRRARAGSRSRTSRPSTSSGRPRAK